MAPKVIDYSKSVIYKIEHVDNPELLYVGSTTDFIRSKSEHKLNSINDIRKSLREVYENFLHYKNLAKKSKEFVRKYDFKNCKQKYLSLIKPQKILLGKENIIADDYIMTNSQSLYDKYKKHIIL